MHYVVLDLEWNIPRLRHKVSAELYKEIPQEIIEIGAVRLKPSLEATGRFSADVKPRYYTELNRHVEMVTQRENASLQNGNSFPRAVRQFMDWCSCDQEEDYLFCTWSNSDSQPWLQNLKHYDIRPKKQPLFLDVQRLHGLASGELSTQRSIAYALEFLELPLNEPFHRAVNDAYYTAQIFKRDVERLQAQSALPKEEKALFQQLRKYAYDPELCYRRRLDLGEVDDPAKIDNIIRQYPWFCPACGQETRPIHPWKKKQGGLRQQNKALCPDHGEILLRCQAFREQAAKPDSPWQIKADLHLQRPL